MKISDAPDGTSAVDVARDVSINLRWASQNIHDWAVLQEHGIASPSNVVMAENSLRSALDALGYDLVPRQSAQAAHEAAIARRVAEDRDFGQQDIVMGR